MTLRLHAAACAVAVVLGTGLTGCASGGRVNPASAYSEDEAIIARVKTALLNDTQIDATTIEIASREGVVTLSGTVKSPAEADRAIQLTRSASGVKTVKSELKVQDRRTTF